MSYAKPTDSIHNRVNAYKKESVERERLSPLIERMKILLEACFLIQLGFGEDEIRQRLYQRYEYIYTMRRIGLPKTKFLNSRQIAFLTSTEIKATFTREDYQQQSDCSKASALQDLRHLCYEDYVRKIGQGRHTKYEVIMK